MSQGIDAVGVGYKNRTQSPAILSAELTIHPRQKPVYLIEVTAPAVVCTPLPLGLGEDRERSKTLVIDAKDIIGCDCLKAKVQSDTNGYLAIYSYPCRRKLASKKNVRRREVVTLTFSQFNDYNSNIKEATRWKGILTVVIQQLTDKIQDTAVLLKPARKLLVLINPFSGQGKALQIFQERVVPMLAEAGLHFNMVVTERAGHAQQIVENMVLDAWHAVVIVSGDGLVFEVINGLMNRSDWEQARLMPIGALPGGSGNALCCTLNHHAGELFTENLVMHSTFVLVKHVVSPMDLVAVDTCRRRVYSFLSITWGLIADIDIESEKYRSLGNARFTVGAISRILGLRSYRGRLSFLPADGEDLADCLTRPVPRRTRSVSNGLAGTITMPPVRSHSMYAVPNGRPTGGTLPEPESPRATGPHHTDPPSHGTALSSPNYLEPACPWTVGPNNNTIIKEHPMRGAAGDAPQTGPVQLDVRSLPGQNPGNAGRTGGGDARPPVGGTKTSSSSTVPTPLLVPLTEPLPDDWVTIEDDFITVAAVFQSHLSTDFCAAPRSQLADGVMLLTFVRAPFSRSRLLQLLFAMETGAYLTHDGQEVVRVKAFRLEPLESRGTISVDGEVVDYGAIQAQILPSMARVLAKTPA